MPVDDYRAAIAGGLKLKGVNPSSKITKHRKKKAKPETQSTAADHSKAEVATPNANSETDPTAISAGESIHDKDDPAGGDGAATPPPPPLPPTQAGKTDAEIKHAERRRKRLDERLKREGTKTHKERVEELNRYLSNLSEHHDMPRIGPG